MAMTAEERSFVTTAIVSVAGGLAVLGVGFEVLERKAAPVPFAISGDTPVVLVGGSMTFKAGDQSYAWQKDSDTEYHISPDYAVMSIAVKAKSTKEDSDDPVASDSEAASDVVRLGVNGATWEIDEFTSASDKAVVSLTQRGNAIYLDLLDTNGSLCFAGTKMKRVKYSPTKTCPATNTYIFSQVSLMVRANGQMQASGTLNCIDGNNTGGTCRIVFRGH
jgi:hypothetical protein